MVTRAIDPNKSAGVWSYDALYPKRKDRKAKEYTKEDLIKMMQSPAVEGKRPMVDTNPSLLQAIKGIATAGDWEEFGKHMPWAPAEGDEPSNAMAALIGTGQFMDKTNVGTRDLLDRFIINVSRGEPVERAKQRRIDRKAEEAEKDRIYAKLEESHPLATLLGEMVPAAIPIPAGAIGKVAAGSKAYKGFRAANAMKDALRGKTAISPLTKAGDAVGRVADKVVNATPEILRLPIAQGAAGALEGAMHYDDTALAGGLLGAGGGFAGKYMTDFLGGATNKLTPEGKRIVDKANELDLFVPSGMATGQRSLQQMDRAVATHRSSRDVFDDLLGQSKIKENRLISKELGGDTTDYFDKEFMDAAENRITGKMDDLTKGVSGYFDESLGARTQKILQDFDDLNMENELPPKLVMYANKIQDAVENGTPLTGEEFQKATQTINRLAKKQFELNGDSDLGRAFAGLSDVYTDAISNGMEGTGEAFKKSRREFAILKAIDKTKKQTTEKGFSGVEGYVSPRKLAENFGSSDIINDLGDIDVLRQSQPGASLGTSALLGKVFKGAVHDPNEALGALSLLSGRMTSPLGSIDEFFVNSYLKGRPHVSGIIPGLNKVKDTAATIPARMLRARETPFEQAPLEYEERPDSETDWETFEEPQGMSVDFTQPPEDAVWETF